MMESKTLKWIEHAERSAKLDYLLFVSGLIASIYVAYLLVYDVEIFTHYQVVETDNREPIAQLESTENIVAYKNANLPVWNSTQKNQPLFLNDQVFTDANSWAQIKFSDDLKINVGQNSLVVVLQSQKKNSIKLEQGTLYVNFDSRGDVTVNLESGDIRLSSDNKAAIELNTEKDGTTTIASLEGEVKVKRANQQTTFGKNKATTIDAKGSLGKTLTLPIFALEPAHNALLKMQNLADTTFSWQTEGALADSILEIAKDQNFKNTLFSGPFESGSKLQQSLGEGHYYWRVKARTAQKKAVQSSVYKLTVIDDRAPVGFHPASNQVFTVTSPDAPNQVSRKSIYFDWQRKFAASSYDFQLASDSQFQNIVSSSLTTAIPHVVADLPPGQYFWRLRARYKNQAEKWGPSQSFAISLLEALPEAKPVPEPPKLAPPKLEIEYHIRPGGPEKPKKKEHSFLQSLLFPVAYAAEPEDSTVITWPAVDGATSYDVQLSASENFSAVLIDTNVAQPKFAFKNLKNGKYFLRIRTVGQDGAKSEFTPASVVYVVHVAIKLLIPADGSNLVKRSANHAVKFTWQVIPGVESYRFEVSKSQQFDRLLIAVTTTTPDTTRTFSKPGVYYWRVGYSLAGSSEFEFSQVHAFSLTAPGVKAPLLAKSIVIHNAASLPQQPAPSQHTQQTMELPLVKLARQWQGRLGLNYLPTRLESISVSAAGKERLKLTTAKAAALDLQYWLYKDYGLDAFFSTLQSAILNDQQFTTKSAKFVLQYRVKPKFYAETQISPRIGVAEKYIVGLKRYGADDTRITVKSFSGAVLGLNFTRALSRDYYFALQFDYFRPADSDLSSSPYHLDSAIKIEHLLGPRLSIGVSYLYDFGFYRFVDEKSELEKITTRQQSVAFSFGWMM